jgi:hypothetical protein
LRDDGIIADAPIIAADRGVAGACVRARTSSLWRRAAIACRRLGDRRA